MTRPCMPRAADASEWAELLLSRRLAELRQAGDGLLAQAGVLAGIADQVAGRLRAGGKVVLAGNGGSACQAQHFAAELLGRLSATRDRSGLAACVLGSDAATVTALANDYGFENVFCRQLQGIAHANDTLVVLSTSGRSENILRAIGMARSLDIFTVALVGNDPADVSSCDAVLIVDADDPGTIQECHLVMIHSLVQLIEDRYDLAR